MPEEIKKLFESLARHPMVFVPKLSLCSIQSYLAGLKAGCRLSGLEYSWEEYLAAAEARGWNPRGAIGIRRDFQEKGLSEETMIEELIAVEADAYSRALSRLSK